MPESEGVRTRPGGGWTRLEEGGEPDGETGVRGGRVAEAKAQPGQSHEHVARAAHCRDLLRSLLSELPPSVCRLDERRWG